MSFVPSIAAGDDMMGSRTSPHPAGQTSSSAMAPSPLDLFLLTFNCAKNLINVGVFASHLYGALSQHNATVGAGLPDLVAFSLQEVAPLSYSFIGSYFLNPYYARYEEALNLASVRLLEAKGLPSDGSQASPKPTPRPYTLVRAKNVGMTAILLFARDPTHIHKIEEAECGFGAADMGNKGAVGLRVTWSDAPNGATAPATEVTLVATHLAAMEWNLKKRNANWRTIVSGLTFANPRDILSGPFPADTSAPRPDQSGAGDTHPRPSSPSDDDDESTLPLIPTPNPLSSADLAALQAASIFKPTSHLFLFGDLNYRISATTPPPLADFPSFDPSSPNYYPSFLPRDQLTQERLAGRTFHGLSEPPITFGPTYKFDVLPDYTAEESTNAAAVRAGATQNGIPEVPWRFAPHRWPGWCDRVLFLDEGVEVGAYDALPVVRSSDHRAVFMRAAVAPLREGAVARREGDPRVEMPVEVDVHAWERRAAARRKELVVGWTAFFWSTREGAVVMATVMAVVVGGVVGLGVGVTAAGKGKGKGWLGARMLGVSGRWGIV